MIEAVWICQDEARIMKDTGLAGANRQPQTRGGMGERDPAKALGSLAVILLALAAILAMVRDFGRVAPPHGLWDFAAFVSSGRAKAADRTRPSATGSMSKGPSRWTAPST